MKIAVALMGLCALAQEPAPPSADPASIAGKVAVVQVQNAIFGTREGQKAAGEIQTKFAPRKAALEQKRQEIAQMEDRLRQGSSTMSDDAKQELARSIEQKTKVANRDAEDAQSEYDEALRRVMQQIGSRMMPLLTKYAKDNQFGMVMDISSQQAPVLYAGEGVDITADLVALYDKSAPPPTTAPAPAPVKK